MGGIIWYLTGLAVASWVFWKVLHRKRSDKERDQLNDPLSFSRTAPRFLFSRDDVTAGPLTYDVHRRSSKAASPK